MFSNLLRDTRGNVATMFGIMIIPITCFVGVGMDYTRATQTRVALQASIDATALMLSRDIKKKLITASDVDAKAKEYVNAQFKRRFASSHTVTAQYEPPSSATGGLAKVSVQATSQVDTILSRFTGVEQLAVATKAEIVWGIRRLEVALVLDNSGSMTFGNYEYTDANNSRMKALKTSTRSLLNTLYEASLKLDDIKVAVVPFTAYVNVGGENVNASWMDWSWRCAQRDSWGNCTRTGPPSTWDGCVWDRASPDDVKEGMTNQLYQALRDSPAIGDCPVALLPLTDIRDTNAWKDEDLNARDRQDQPTATSTIGKKIASMEPSGATNGVIGTVWGWNAITRAEPLTQAALDPNDEIDQVIIMLTDGENTRMRGYGTGQAGSCSTCNTRFSDLCTNLRTAKIQVYTVRLLGGDETRLRNCATDPSMYRNVADTAQLNAVFTTIAQNLAKLRIAK